MRIFAKVLQQMRIYKNLYGLEINSKIYKNFKYEYSRNRTLSKL